MERTDIAWNDTGRLEVLTFEWGCATFAIEASRVREILDPVRETRVPCCPKHIGSIVNYRGRLIPLVDFRPMFRQPAAPNTDDSRFIVLECAEMQPISLFAMKADRVHEVTAITKSQVESVSDYGLNLDPAHLRFMINVGTDLILMPDVIAVLTNMCRLGHTNAPAQS